MTAPGQRIQSLEPLPGRLISRPLDFILADHHRHRVLCSLCEALASAETFDPVLAGSVADHIETALADHVADEEEDFFPLLRRRSKREDEVGPVLDRLADDHAEDEKLAAKIVRGLRKRIGDPDQPMSVALRRTLRAFAAGERRHLAIENAIVIPLAKVRLSPQDLAELAERMAARRTADAGRRAASSDE